MKFTICYTLFTLLYFKPCFRSLCHPARKQIRPILQLPRPTRGYFIYSHSNNPYDTIWTVEKHWKLLHLLMP